MGTFPLHSVQWKKMAVCLLSQSEWEFVWRSIASASRILNPDHLSMLINQRKPNTALPSHQPPWNHAWGGKRFCALVECRSSICFFKKLSWLTCHWTSPLCLLVTANVSRCLFRARFQSLIYAWDDNAILHVILQEREESITNGIHAKQALLFPLSVPPRFSTDTLTSAEHWLRAHTVCHNSFSSITAGPAGLGPLYLQLGKLTPLNSKIGEAFRKIYKMKSRKKKKLPPFSLSLHGSIIQGFTVWKKVSFSCKSCNWILFIHYRSANHKSKKLYLRNDVIIKRYILTVRDSTVIQMDCKHNQDTTCDVKQKYKIPDELWDVVVQTCCPTYIHSSVGRWRRHIYCIYTSFNYTVLSHVITNIINLETGFELLHLLKFLCVYFCIWSNIAHAVCISCAM